MFKHFLLILLISLPALAGDCGCGSNPELNIQIGHFYKTRDGHKVRIYALDGSGNYFSNKQLSSIHGAIFKCNQDSDGPGWIAKEWTPKGAAWSDGQRGDLDIVSEWNNK